MALQQTSVEESNQRLANPTNGSTHWNAIESNLGRGIWSPVLGYPRCGSTGSSWSRRKNLMSDFTKLPDQEPRDSHQTGVHVLSVLMAILAAILIIGSIARQ